MKRILALSAIAVCALVAIPAGAATKSLAVGDDYFVHSGGTPVVTVSNGTTIKWVWRGKQSHNVYVQNGPQRFHSSAKVHGSYTHKLTRGGTYLIVCTIHPGMQMKLKVR